MQDYPPALFTYTLTPNSVPRSSAQPSTIGLLLAVNNATGRDVTCDQIGFGLTEGDDGGQLTSDVSTINTAVTSGTHWSFSRDGSYFTAIPKTGYEVLHNGETIAFLLTDITVNKVSGLVVIDIYESTEPDCTTRKYPAKITKVDQSLGVTQFSASSMQVDPGGSTVLTWTTSGATTATLLDGVSNRVGTSGTTTETPQITTTYTLIAHGATPDVQASLTVAVPEVRILDFEASPTTLAQGATTTLSWQVIGAASAVIDPGGHQLDDVAAGTLPLSVDEPTRFVLKAVGNKRSASQEAPVNVPPVGIDSFTATPAVVAPGNASTLEWATGWASTCRVDQGVGDVERCGQRPVSPASTTTYRLTANGYRGPATRDVTVGVGAAITALGFKADPANPGQVELTWGTFVDGSGKVTVAVDGGAPASVPPVGVKTIPLIVDTATSVQLVVAGPTTQAVASLTFLGPMITSIARFTRLALACPPGVNATGATATVQWVATLGTVVGTVQNAQGDSSPVSASNGDLTFGLGTRAPNMPLWQGNLQIGQATIVQWQVS